ncbi:MAG: ribonuclease III [bacterium]|nr:ribonuclease III [bacterium]
MNKKRKDELLEQERRLELDFTELQLLDKALTHSSHGKEKKKEKSARLEFLGDAVLGLIVAESLFHKFPDLAEGELTKIRSSLVSRPSIASIGKRIGISDFILLSKGEVEAGGRKKTSIIAEALEAVIGAIYLDKGIEEARKFIEKHWQDYSIEYSDYKSELQEVVQKTMKEIPKYKVIKREGLAHQPYFRVQVKAGEIKAQGEGRSKKEAEKAAAGAALSILRSEEYAKTQES